MRSGEIIFTNTVHLSYAHSQSIHNPTLFPIPHHLLHLPAYTPTLSKLLPHQSTLIKRPTNLLRRPSQHALGSKLLTNPALRVESRTGSSSVSCFLAGVRGVDEAAAGHVGGGIFVDALGEFGFFEAAGGERC